MVPTEQGTSVMRDGAAKKRSAAHACSAPSQLSVFAPLLSASWSRATSQGRASYHPASVLSQDCPSRVCRSAYADPSRSGFGDRRSVVPCSSNSLFHRLGEGNTVIRVNAANRGVVAPVPVAAFIVFRSALERLR